MSRPRIVELCLEACDRAAEAVELFAELEAASQHCGTGIHRDALNIRLDLCRELLGQLTTVREARDEAERLECCLP
jgi:hypothetical protein